MLKQIKQENRTGVAGGPKQSDKNLTELVFAKKSGHTKIKKNKIGTGSVTKTRLENKTSKSHVKEKIKLRQYTKIRTKGQFTNKT